MLSWTCTFHRVQGVSLDEGETSVNQGQIHVVFSRIRSIEKMLLVGN